MSLKRRLPSPRAEHGSILVEVLVGTLMLGLATTAVLNGIDGAQDVGRQNKDRSVSATLAQQDLERMRSMPPTALTNYSDSREVVVGGVAYLVNSRTDWVVDASGLVSCTSDDTEAEYMKLTSTVSAPARPDRPVVATSLLTPPPGAFADDTGTAAVKLTDRDGEPHAGVAVSLTGPGSLSATTNDVGCAIFGFVDAGTWTASVDGGLVGWNGLTPAQSPVTIAEGKTSLTQIELDTPASLRATFETPSGVPTQWTSIGVVNSKLPGGVEYFPAEGEGALESSKDGENLFPFYDGYGVYAGSCAANNPALWDEDYFQTSGKGYAEVDPGEALHPVEVVVPQLEVTVQRTNGTAFTDYRIYVQQIDDDFECETVFYDSGVVSGSATSQTVDVQLPFGNYEVCAAVRASGTWRRKFTGNSGVPADPDLTEAPLEQSITMSIPTSGSTGTCTPPTP